MGCDFFYPRVGGVEQHIWSLSQSLLSLGHRVVIVTGRYICPNGGTPRVGVRYMAGGLRVYYLPHAPMADQASLPTYFALLPMLRSIFLREAATIAHGHAATSVFTHDFIVAARSLGIPAVYTDHSLFGSRSFAHINVNKYLSFVLRDVAAVITVSESARENLCERADVDPSLAHTIPNAVDTSRFEPPHTHQQIETGGGASAVPAPVTIVMVSRLVFRKGIDIAAQVIPRACAQWPHVRFVIGGDGPKMALLEKVRRDHALSDRVELLGNVPHDQVRNVLIRGTIFLNCSLTESFCIAILEAAATGCYVVATNVGGVPEVLPAHMVTLAEPDADDLMRALGEALVKAALIDRRAQHDEVSRLYSWPEVAARTVRVYDAMRSAPTVTLADRFVRLAGSGLIFGPLTVILAALIQIMAFTLEILSPAEDIEATPQPPKDEELFAAACAPDSTERESSFNPLRK
jgi:phosphatidylinositol glycan class A protein